MGFVWGFQRSLLGVKNRNKNTSKFLTLSPCFDYGVFLAFLAVLGQFQRIFFSSTVVLNERTIRLNLISDSTPETSPTFVILNETE